MCGLYEYMDAKTLTGTDCDVQKIERAFAVADNAHRGQMRRSGEPCIAHAAAVAVILVDWGMDTDTVVAGLLHDVVEDTLVELAGIRQQFGEDVAQMVECVAKLGRIPTCSRSASNSEDIPKMLLAMARDVRAVIVKLAERLHIMRTADSMHCAWQRNISLEVLEVYVPVAHRLGLRPVEEELANLCIHCLDPIIYAEIVSRLEKSNMDRAGLNGICTKLSEQLGGQNPGLRVDGTVMSIYEIYQNMYYDGKEFEEIYNIYTVRMIVDTVQECYEILGAVHNLFHPIPYRFQDFIATPKTNGYQSIHTTVLGEEGVPFEVQIRTSDMHRAAEYGSAPNWGQEGQRAVTGGMPDFSSDRVYVFTPKGDVIALPVGATVIDFAYAVHADIGNRMVGARVDGRIVPLTTQLQNAQIVEALTSNRCIGPSPDWLHVIKTESAGREIRKRLNLEHTS